MTLPTTKLQSRFADLSLRRIVTSNRFIPEVDGFRFVAILVVIIAHINGQCTPILGHDLFSRVFARAFAVGGRGVFLFFTISGFILALPFARHHLQGDKRVRLASYFRRRVTRLEPPYVLAMLLRTPALLLLKHTPALALMGHLAASLFYVHSLVFAASSSINPPAWSLEVEIQFYLLAPILTGLFLIRNKHLRRLLFVGLMLASSVLAYLYLPPVGRLSLTLLDFLQYFLAGFLLCDFYLVGDRPRLPGWAWDVLGGAALAWILLSQAPWYTIAMPFASLLLYLAGFYGTVIRGFFALRPISLIGGMCYSIYLTHTTVLAAVAPLAHRLERSSLPIVLQTPAIYVISCGLVLVVGTIFFVLVERPCMDPQWPHKLMVRLRGR